MFPFRTKPPVALLFAVGGLLLGAPPLRAGEELKQALKSQVANIAGYLAGDRETTEVRLAPDKGLERVAIAVQELLLQASPPIRSSPGAKHELRIGSSELKSFNADPDSLRVNLAVHEASRGKLRDFPVVFRGELALVLQTEAERSMDLARRILERLAQAKQSEVNVLGLTGPRGTCSLGLTEELVANIGRLSAGMVKVTTGAKLTFHCTYSVKATDKGVVLSFSGFLRDANNEAVHEVTAQQPLSHKQPSINVDAAVPVLVFSGFTGEINPNQDNKTRVESVPDRAGKPTGTVDKDGVARSAPKSPYGVRLLVDRKPRAVEEANGFLASKLNLGESYSVELRNDSDHDACVSLWIDGLNMFHFSAQGKALNLMIGKGKSAVIPGWFFTKDRSREFQVMSLKNTPAGSLQSPLDAVGTVTAVFARAYEHLKDVSDDELALRARIDQSDTVATGVGRDVSVHYEQVNRYLGAVRSSVTIRYAQQ